MSYAAELQAAHVARQQRLGYAPMPKPVPRVMEPPAVEPVQPERDWLDVAAPTDPLSPRLPQWDWRERAAKHMTNVLSKTTAIQIAVCCRYHVNHVDLLSIRRTQNISWPRQIGMYLAKTMTAHSFPQIGRRFGGKDHTTVLHAVRKVEPLRNIDPKFSAELDELEAVIRNSPAFTGMVL